MIEVAVLVAFPAMMAFAAASDFVTMTIPNRLAIALVVTFVIMACLSGLRLDLIAWHVGVSAIALLIGFAMFARGWIGGGDAKLAAATAIWLGTDSTAEYLLFAGVGGGLLTLAILYFRSRPISPLAVRLSCLVRLHDPSCGVPYGMALAGAALAVYPHTEMWNIALRG